MRRARQIAGDRGRQPAVELVQAGDVGGRRRQHQGADALRVPRRQPGCDRAAEAVPDDCRACDAARVERGERRPSVPGEAGRRATAVPTGAVDGDRLNCGVELGEDGVPVARASGLAVQQQDRRAAAAAFNERGRPRGVHRARRPRPPGRRARRSRPFRRAPSVSTATPYSVYRASRYSVRQPRTARTCRWA